MRDFFRALLLCALLFITMTAAADSVVMTPNLPVNEQLSDYRDMKQYTISFDQPGSLAFRLQFVPGGEYIVELLSANADGELVELQKNDFYFNKETVAGTITRTGDVIRLPAGTYYLKVHPDSRSSFRDDPFTLTAVWQPEPGEEYEKEFNQPARYAMPINVNTDITGNLSSRKDEDFYSALVLQPGILQVRFRFAPEGDYNMRLYAVNADGGLDEIQFVNFFFSGNAQSETISRDADRLRVPAGEYFIQIEAFNSSGYSNSDYTLSVLYTMEPGSDTEKEFNDTAASASTITPGQSVIGNLGGKKDEDFYRFSLDQHSSVQISMEFPDKGDYYVTLYGTDAGGGLEQLGTVNFYAANPTAAGIAVQTTKVYTLDPGLYFIKISVFNQKGYHDGDYRLSVLAE